MEAWAGSLLVSEAVFWLLLSQTERGRGREEDRRWNQGDGGRLQHPTLSSLGALPSTSRVHLCNLYNIWVWKLGETIKGPGFPLNGYAESAWWVQK